MVDQPLSTDGHGAPTPSTATGDLSGGTWQNGVRLEALANLAHELRTPVQVLLGFIDILRDDHVEEFSADARALLERMNANVHDLAQTVDNLMHFVMSDVRAESVIDDEVTPGSLAAEIAPVLEAANQQKNLKVDLNFGGAPEVFCVPRRQLRLIVMNLAINAIKFTDAGSVTVALRHRRDTAAGSVLEVEVSDTGPGLSPSIFNRARQPFAQLSNTSARRYRGVGLGLAVVQRSVDALGGRIELHQNGDHGTSFIVTIPIRLRDNSSRPARLGSALRPLPLIPAATSGASRKPSSLR